MTGSLSNACGCVCEWQVETYTNHVHRLFKQCICWNLYKCVTGCACMCLCDNWTGSKICVWQVWMACFTRVNACVWVFIVHHSLVISLQMTCTALVNACVTTECMCDRCSLFFLQLVWQLNKRLELGYWGLCDWCHKGDLWWQLCHYLLPFWPTCLF